jgi:hypothetical protein
MVWTPGLPCNSSIVFGRMQWRVIETSAGLTPWTFAELIEIHRLI